MSTSNRRWKGCSVPFTDSTLRTAGQIFTPSATTNLLTHPEELLLHVPFTPTAHRHNATLSSPEFPLQHKILSSTLPMSLASVLTPLP
jgi:hypothetical protein